MWRITLIIVMLLFSLILPGTFFHFLAWGNIKPDLVVLFTIYLALHHKTLPGAMWGLGVWTYCRLLLWQAFWYVCPDLNLCGIIS